MKTLLNIFIALALVSVTGCGGEEKTVIREGIDDSARAKVAILEARLDEVEAMLDHLDSRVDDIDVGLLDVEDQLASSGGNTPLVLVEDVSGAELGRVIGETSGDRFYALTSEGYYFSVVAFNAPALDHATVYFASSGCVGVPYASAFGTGKIRTYQGAVFLAKDDDGVGYFYTSPAQETITFKPASTYNATTGLCGTYNPANPDQTVRQALRNDPAVTGFPSVALSFIRVQ